MEKGKIVSSLFCLFNTFTIILTKIKKESFAKSILKYFYFFLFVFHIVFLQIFFTHFTVFKNHFNLVNPK